MEDILLDNFILNKDENFSSTERDDLKQLLLEENLKVKKENYFFKIDVEFCLCLGWYKSKHQSPNTKAPEMFWIRFIAFRSLF